MSPHNPRGGAEGLEWNQPGTYNTPPTGSCQGGPLHPRSLRTRVPWGRGRQPGGQ